MAQIKIMPRQPFKIINQTTTSGCACSTPAFLDDQVKDTPRTDGNLTIDGQSIAFKASDKTIVDVAQEAGITIPAPCYHTEKSHGCCSACVVEIDGDQAFACATVPKNGMTIVVDREDLKAIRIQRLKEYKDGIKNGSPCKCSAAGLNKCC